MKKVLFALLVFAIPTWSAAQEVETLVGGDLRSGGFGGPVVKLTEINDAFGVLVGARGGWIINDSFVLGGGIYGLANEDDFHVHEPDRRGLVMGYGGLEMEYILRPNSLTHLSFSVLVGGGAVAWGDFDHDNEDPFFITEPGVNVMLNVTKFMRIGFGASYRFVEDVELRTLDNSAIDGASGSLTFKFGGF